MVRSACGIPCLASLNIVAIFFRHLERESGPLPPYLKPSLILPDKLMHAGTRDVASKKWRAQRVLVGWICEDVQAMVDWLSPLARCSDSQLQVGGVDSILCFVRGISRIGLLDLWMEKRAFK